MTQRDLKSTQINESVVGSDISNQSFKLSVSLFPGSGCSAVGGGLPGLIGATGPSVMMKPFLPFPVETTSPVGLFPNFNTVCDTFLWWDGVGCSLQYRLTELSLSASLCQPEQAHDL